jgi:phage shock protein PspC (stress-responsive transcriptional regulator)
MREHDHMDSKRLTRSSNDRMLGGVAAGMADYFGVDPSVMRILWVLVALVGGTGLLVYVVLWVALPEGHTSPAAPSSGAVAIAEERYARGEITADELALIKEDLGR